MRSPYWTKHGDAANVWDYGLPPGGQACEACGTPTESEPCPDHQPYEGARQLLDVDGLLVELSESPLPGARYAYEVVKRRLLKETPGPQLQSEGEGRPTPDSGPDRSSGPIVTPSFDAADRMGRA